MEKELTQQLKRRIPKNRRIKEVPRLIIRERDKEIILEVLRSRFLRRDQIERLFFSSTVACNRRLKMLYQHGFLERIYQPVSFGLAQACYALDKEGARLVAKELKKRKLSYQAKRVFVGSSIQDDYLVIPYKYGYNIYVGAVVEGIDLHANWSLEEKNAQGCLTRIPVIGLIILSILQRDAFNIMNRVKAFASVVLDCTAQAAEQIATEGKLDKKIKHESSRRLGPL